METAQKEEFTRVQRVSDNKYNLITADGKLLLDEWYDFVSDFFVEVAVIVRGDGDFNFINKQGKLLSKQWFEFVDDFKAGLARVKRSTDKLWNFIGEDGKIISDEWFRYVDYFRNGLARVERTNGEWAKIDTNGKISE